MNWANLTKEQKQLRVLAVTAGLIVVAALVQFVVRPALDRAERTKADLDQVRASLDKANAAFKRELAMTQESMERKQSLERAVREYVPAYGNTLSWATERLYTLARQVGVSIESMAGGGALWGGAPDASQPGGRAFIPFSALVALQCSYADLLRFLQALEQDNPYVCVTSLVIEGREQMPEKHRVTLTLEWPSWARSPAPAGSSAQPKAGRVPS